MRELFVENENWKCCVLGNSSRVEKVFQFHHDDSGRESLLDSLGTRLFILNCYSFDWISMTTPHTRGSEMNWLTLSAAMRINSLWWNIWRFMRSTLSPATASRKLSSSHTLFMSAHTKSISHLSTVYNLFVVSCRGTQGAKWTDPKHKDDMTGWKEIEKKKRKEVRKGEEREKESSQQTKWKVIYEISLFNRRQPLKWQKKNF